MVMTHHILSLALEYDDTQKRNPWPTLSFNCLYSSKESFYSQ